MHAELNKRFDRIAQRKSKLLAKLDSLDAEHLEVAEADGKWSVAQVIAHLALSERMSVEYCQKKLLAGDNLPESKLRHRIKSTCLNLFLLSNIKYKAPVRTIQPGQNMSYQDACIEWYNARQTLLRFLDNFPDKYLDKAIYKHPIIGRVNLLQMLSFFDAHLKHHEAQINRILKAIGQ